MVAVLLIADDTDIGVAGERNMEDVPVAISSVKVDAEIGVGVAPGTAELSFADIMTCLKLTPKFSQQYFSAASEVYY